jgi:hypothetical protein
VLRLLRSVCSPGGGLLALEDLHWADPETVSVVEHLGDHLDRAPVLCVATVRSEEPGPARELVRRVAARRSAQVLELGRLDDAQVAAMIDGCTRGRPGDGVEQVAALCDGVPFLVEELLAVDGDGFRFRHALTAEAVFRSLSPPRRTALASRALAVWEASGDGRREVVAALAERAGRPDRAGRLLVEAGEDALEHGALHTAVLALERGRSLLAAGPARDAAGRRLVEALALAGRVDDALGAARDLAGRLPPASAAAVHLRVAGAAITAARWEAAREQLAAARRLLDDGDPAGPRAELALREGELALGTGDGARAEELAASALELARREAAVEVECAALLLLGRCARRTSLAAAEDRFRQALAAADADGLALWRLRALHEVGTIALLDRSEVAALVEAQELAEALGAMATAAILDIEIAAGCASVHDLDGAARHGSQAVRRGTELGLDLVVAFGWHHVAGSAALRGDRDQVERAAAAARAAAPGTGTSRACWWVSASWRPPSWPTTTTGRSRRPSASPRCSAARRRHRPCTGAPPGRCCWRSTTGRRRRPPWRSWSRRACW